MCINIKAGKQDGHNNDDQRGSSLFGIIEPTWKSKIAVKLNDQKKNEDCIHENITQGRQPRRFAKRNRAKGFQNIDITGNMINVLNVSEQCQKNR